MKVLRYHRDAEISYTLGATLTFELLKFRPELMNRVFISSETELSGGIRKLVDACEAKHIPVEKNDKAFHILSPKGNCYVIAEFRKEDVKLQPGNHVILVNPSDAGNLGTIVRTMTGFGVRELAIVRSGVDIYDPRTVRATMGAVFHIRAEYYDTFEDYIKRFPKNRRFAFMLTGSKMLPEVIMQEQEREARDAVEAAPFSLIFGNEATGLPDEFAETCTAVRINHSGDIDSLNLPMAAGIGLYEFTKTRWNPQLFENITLS